MRIEISYKGVAKNRIYFATPITAGRPRKSDEIIKSKKPFGTGATRSEAIGDLLKKVSFVPHNEIA